MNSSLTKKHNWTAMKETRKVLRKEMPKGEKLLWYRLKSKQLGYKFRRQFSFEHFVLDFYCPQLHLGIEVDGITHEDEKYEYDKRRQLILESQGITIIRFTSQEVFDDLDNVIERIVMVCDKVNRKT